VIKKKLNQDFMFFILIQKMISVEKKKIVQAIAYALNTHQYKSIIYEAECIYNIFADKF